MPEEDYGTGRPGNHPENHLAEDGKKAFLERAGEVREALAGGSLAEACDRLGHRKDSPSASLARELLEKLSSDEQSIIASRVRDALDKGQAFPFICTLKDADLKNASRVYAHEEERDGRTVIVITETATGPEDS